MNVIPSPVYTPSLTYEVMSKWIMIKMSLNYTSRNGRVPKPCFHLISFPSWSQGHISRGQQPSFWNTLIPLSEDSYSTHYLSMWNDKVGLYGIAENFFPWIPSLDCASVKDQHLDDHLCIVSHNTKISLNILKYILKIYL